jgi:putative SOS response-associated peptidase YedK
LPPVPFWITTYNAAPKSYQPIIRLAEETGEVEVVPALWSIIPVGILDPKDLKFSTFNARSEDLREKKTFRESIEKNRRCLVPASIFYEWKKLTPSLKKPYAIGMKSGKPFAFAGLWHPWTAPDGTVVPTFTVITTAPNEMIETEGLHDRMPCILAPDQFERWLRPCDPEEPPFDLLRPYPSEEMKFWPVDPAVGNTRVDHADLIREPTQGLLF